MLQALLHSALTTHTQQHLHRQRYQLDDQSIVFASNDYLGLADHPQLTAAFKSALDAYGVGSGASHLISGHHPAHAQLEADVAAFLNVPRALVFSTGFMANLGLLTALVPRDGIIYADKYNHASLIDGARFAPGQLKRYPHAQLEQLAQQLQCTAAVANKFIVSDGVFSMDGDVADLPTLRQLAQRHQAALLIDDAHGIGVLGASGRGIYQHHHCQLGDDEIITGTFGKALGCFGAFVAGSDALIEYLIQFARTYIFTTAMPPALAATISAALQLIDSESWRRQRLLELIDYFRQAALARGLLFMPSSTPIQPLLIGDEQAAMQVAAQLRAQGFFVTAIRTPTVPKGQARLRITLQATHREAQIDALLSALQQILER